VNVLKVQEVLFIHSVVIDETGGTHGIRDLGLLKSAVAQPLHTFGGQDLYPTLVLKAAALVSALAKNHPFVDGNKRTAAVTLGVFLELNGENLKASQKELVEFMVGLASEKMDVAKASRWIENHI